MSHPGAHTLNPANGQRVGSQRQLILPELEARLCKVRFRFASVAPFYHNVARAPVLWLIHITSTTNTIWCRSPRASVWGFLTRAYQNHSFGLSLQRGCIVFTRSPGRLTEPIGSHLSDRPRFQGPLTPLWIIGAILGRVFGCGFGDAPIEVSPINHMIVGSQSRWNLLACLQTHILRILGSLARKLVTVYEEECQRGCKTKSETLKLTCVSGVQGLWGVHAVYRRAFADRNTNADAQESTAFQSGVLRTCRGITSLRYRILQGPAFTPPPVRAHCASKAGAYFL